MSTSEGRKITLNFTGSKHATETSPMCSRAAQRRTAGPHLDLRCTVAECVDQIRKCVAPHEHSSHTSETAICASPGLTLSLDGSRRVEFRINVNSDATWMNAASRGLRKPAAAKPIPIASTMSVP